MTKPNQYTGRQIHQVASTFPLRTLPEVHSTFAYSCMESDGTISDRLLYPQDTLWNGSVLMDKSQTTTAVDLESRAARITDPGIGEFTCPLAFLTVSLAIQSWILPTPVVFSSNLC